MVDFILPSKRLKAKLAMENVSNTGARATRRRRGNNWSLSGSKASRRKQKQNSKFNIEEFKKSKREWMEYVRSLTTEDKRTLLFNIVHVLPDVTKPNRDLESLNQGVNWLKSCLKENSSVEDKNAGILQSSAPTAVSRKSAGSPSLQTGEEHESSTCLQTGDEHVSPALTSGMLDSSITAATTLVHLHNQYHGANAETSSVKPRSQRRKTQRQVVLDERVQERETTKKRLEYVGKVTRAFTAQEQRSQREKRVNKDQHQRETAKLLVQRKQRSQQLAHQLIDSRDVAKCTTLLLESDQRAARCVELISKLQYFEKKCVSAEKALDIIKQTRVDTPAADDYILTSSMSQHEHDRLLEFVQTVTKGEREDTSRRDALDEGFPTETWYEFNPKEAQVCTYTHLVYRHSY